MSHVHPVNQDAIEDTDGVRLPQDHADAHFPKVRYCLSDPLNKDDATVSHLSKTGLLEIDICAMETRNQIQDFDEFLAFMGPQLDSVPALDRKAEELTLHFKDVNDLFIEFISNLKRKNEEIERSLREIPRLLNDQGKWWEKTNIFLPEITRGSIREVQNLTVPESLDYAEYLSKCMHIYRESHDEFRTAGQREWFFDLLDEETTRIFDMPHKRSWETTLKLYIKIQLDVLQPRDMTVCLDCESTKYREIVNQSLARMTSGSSDFATQSHEKYSVNTAKLCREVRERMHRHHCNMIGGHCVYNTLIPTLDILQRHAYEEIRHNVHIAVDDCLPIELEMMVFEYAMLAEEVPMDPRIFVDARNISSKEHARKTRLICDHAKNYDVGEPRLHVGEGVTPLVFGSDWKEYQPCYPHYDHKARRDQNKRCPYEFSDWTHAYIVDSDEEEEPDWGDFDLEDLEEVTSLQVV